MSGYAKGVYGLTATKMQWWHRRRGYLRGAHGEYLQDEAGNRIRCFYGLRERDPR